MCVCGGLCVLVAAGALGGGAFGAGAAAQELGSSGFAKGGGDKHAPGDAPDAPDAARSAPAAQTLWDPFWGHLETLAKGVVALPQHAVTDDASTQAGHKEAEETASTLPLAPAEQAELAGHASAHGEGGLAGDEGGAAERCCLLCTVSVTGTQAVRCERCPALVLHLECSMLSAGAAPGICPQCSQALVSTGSELESVRETGDSAASVLPRGRRRGVHTRRQRG